MLKLLSLIVAVIPLVFLAACSETPKPAKPEVAVTESKPEPVAVAPVVAVVPVVEAPKEDAEAKRKQIESDQLNQYLAEAEALLSVSYQRLGKDEDDVARDSLQSAYGKIQQAKAVDAGDQRINKALNSLGDKYLSMIEASADDKAYHRAEGFIDDSLAMDIDSTNILAAKEQIGKDILKKARQFDRF